MLAAIPLVAKPLGAGPGSDLMLNPARHQVLEQQQDGTTPIVAAFNTQVFFFSFLFFSFLFFSFLFFSFSFFFFLSFLFLSFSSFFLFYVFIYSFLSFFISLSLPVFTTATMSVTLPIDTSPPGCTCLASAALCYRCTTCPTW